MGKNLHLKFSHSSTFHKVLIILTHFKIEHRFLASNFEIMAWISYIIISKIIITPVLCIRFRNFRRGKYSQLFLTKDRVGTLLTAPSPIHYFVGTYCVDEHNWIMIYTIDCYIIAHLDNLIRRVVDISIKQTNYWYFNKTIEWSVF